MLRDLDADKVLLEGVEPLCVLVGVFLDSEDLDVFELVYIFYDELLAFFAGLAYSKLDFFSLLLPLRGGAAIAGLARPRLAALEKDEV